MNNSNKACMSAMHPFFHIAGDRLADVHVGATDVTPIHHQHTRPSEFNLKECEFYKGQVPEGATVRIECPSGEVSGRYLVVQHDDVIKWKHFPRYWPFVRGIHRSPVNSPHKGQWRGAVLFDPGLNKQLSKQLWGWWFETLSCSLWRHCNGWMERTIWPFVKSQQQQQCHG